MARVTFPAFLRIAPLLSLVALGCVFPPASGAAEAKYDVCVYGGTSSGVMAAVAAARMGKEVILIEPGKRLGGLSASGLGMTDVGNKHAVTGLAREFYRKLGERYGKFEQWRFEPHVAEEIFNRYVEEAGIPVLFEKWLIDVEKIGPRIDRIWLRNPESGKDTVGIRADMYIDCTYEGDLMAKAGVSYTIGRESNDTYGETYNGVQLVPHSHQFPDGIDPYVAPGDPDSGLLPGIQPGPVAANGTGDRKVQAYNFRMCLTKEPGNRVPFYRPEVYRLEEYELLLRWLATRDDWSLRDLLILSRMPNGKTDANNKGSVSTDFIGRNWEYPDGDYETRKRITEEHKHYIQGLLYFLRTDPRVPEGLREDANAWGYAADEFTDNGHFPHQMYVREARRMIGEYVMTEMNCLGERTVHDGVGKGAYGMDSHFCQRVVVDGMVKNEGNLNIEGFPAYPISYRSITPKREECENLLVPVALSASHIAYGSIRMEPVFMVLGQSSGMAAAYAIDQDAQAQTIDVARLQRTLESDPALDGTPPDVLADDSDPGAVQYQGDWREVERLEIPQPYMGSYLISESKAETGQWVRYTPRIETPGTYEIFVFHPIVLGWKQPYSSATTYEIKASGKTEERRVDFSQLPINQNWGEWVSLGSHRFEGSGGEYVQLVGGSSKAPLVADAMIFVWRE